MVTNVKGQSVKEIGLRMESDLTKKQENPVRQKGTRKLCTKQNGNCEMKVIICIEVINKIKLRRKTNQDKTEGSNT